MLKTPVLNLLSQAVERSIELQAQGDTPHESLVKTAQLLKLSPQQIDRTAQLLNRSSVSLQRMHSDSLFDKLANVDVIEPAKVIAEVYQQPSKVAGMDAVEIVLSKLNTLEQNELSQAKLAVSPLRVKVADAPLVAKISQAEDSFGLYHGLQNVELVRERQLQQRKIAEAESQLRYLRGTAQVLLDSLVHTVRSFGRKEAAAIIDQAKVYFEERSPAAREIVLFLADTVLPEEVQAKLAISPQVPDVWHPKLFAGGFVAAVQKLATLVERADEAATWMVEPAALAQARLEFLDKTASGGRVENMQLTLKGGETAKQLDEQNLLIETRRKLAGPISSFAGSLMGASAHGAAKPAHGMGEPSDVERYSVKLRTPQHEATLASVRSRAALQELMTADPVISSHAPDEVIDSFNELSEFSPNSVEHLAVMRAALRTLLQKNTSIFDLQQISGVDRSLKQKSTGTGVA